MMKQRWILVSVVLSTTLILDQVTKILARQYLNGQERMNYLNGMFALEYAENPGAFLSFGAGMNETMRFLIFSLGVVFILLWAGYLLARRMDLEKVEVWGLALLLSGGIGNLIDRLAKGSVTDFMQMGIGGLYTGIFNIADMAIMGGVACMLLTSFLTKKKDPRRAA